MQPTIGPPNVRELYLPLLACLPTAFVSPRPPPALLPLLSPILRQRVHLHTSDPQQSRNPQGESAWLKLLTWSPARAAKLSEVVSNLQLEPHPVSGEIELFSNDEDGTEGQPVFRRWDAEVFQASISDHEHRLTVIWVWCTNDTGGVGLENAATRQPEDGWRVSEVFSVDDWSTEQKPEWYPSIAEAEAAAAAQAAHRPAAPERTLSVPGQGQSAGGEESNEDDYWAMYDRTPGGRTPMKHSPAPFSMTNGLSNGGRSSSVAQEDAYFSRYEDVQPAMDAHDPDEEQDASQADTTLHGEAFTLPPTERRGRELLESYGNGPELEPFPMPAHHASTTTTTTDNMEAPYPSEPVRANVTVNGPDRIHSPKPSRPSSSRADSPQSNAVAALEARARSISSSSAVELGIKQHISTEIKSLFRLCKGVGIERDEFRRIVEREIEVLALMDGDDNNP